MSDYGALSAYYDFLTDNVDYKKYAGYIKDKFKENAVTGIVLDAGCGTGRMMRLLLDDGFDVIGADHDENMLALAAENCPGALLLYQDIRKLDLYGTIHGAVSTLDVVNHLDSLDDVMVFFSRVSLFMERDGIFVFDCNLPYKHAVILKDNAFVFELDDGMLIWRNNYLESARKVEIELDLFVLESSGGYIRKKSFFCEYAYTVEEIEHALSQNGFRILEVLDGESFLSLHQESQRAVITAKRI